MAGEGRRFDEAVFAWGREKNIGPEGARAGSLFLPGTSGGLFLE